MTLHTTRNIMTGEAHTFELKPNGMTEGEALAFLAEREAAGKLINPATCECIKYYAEACDIYGIYIVPDEWQCAGNELFVRNPDSNGLDRFWVWDGDLPRDICMAVYARLGWLTDEAALSWKRELAEPVSATPSS
jgi:hypothetical protein